MALEVLHGMKSIVATASFASKQYTFVTLDSNGQAATPSAGAGAVGVMQDKPAASDPGAVCGPGSITKVVAGGSFNAGDMVMTDGDGKAVVATTGSKVLGRATSSGSANKIATILFQPEGTL